ncbi:rRNA pseudouridine synthase [Chitinophagaceae bacterium LB-8]|uniref:Pseudouridine synthase n=1 Tax=Paraflavisolibacter caeni TaxID=2982496 RepID=A0A9X2XRZ4_9BACT|nr:pseudouridine synthase [Paraflavisolibacter caeni]MCU7547849.1 rRNA pseudouridine synthase [Paraflavisolibacter caeni]
MKKQSGFEKFIKGKKKAGTVKEEIRQEKRKLRKEIEEKKKDRFKFQNPEYKPQQEGKGSSRFTIKKTKTSRDQSERPERRTSSNFRTQSSKSMHNASEPVKKTFGAKKPDLKITKTQNQQSDQMPLNKYIAHCGVCSRRDAAEVVKSGKVKVNGELITEPGHKVSLDDAVIVAGKKVHPVKNLVYILLNKPKDYITTTDDPQKRKTVLDLINQATQERVYPVGRLDRNTSGVLLLTNDGDLSQKLTHPSNEIRKIYAVTLDKPLEKKHFEEILKGVTLEDGVANIDVLAYSDSKDKTQIGVELHSGRNRIVRRIFEHFGYDVKNLDRVMFAGLTKKNVQRGKWRFLSEKEVRELKYFRKGK